MADMNKEMIDLLKEIKGALEGKKGDSSGSTRRTSRSDVDEGESSENIQKRYEALKNQEQQIRKNAEATGDYSKLLEAQNDLEELEIKAIEKLIQEKLELGIVDQKEIERLRERLRLKKQEKRDKEEGISLLKQESAAVKNAALGFLQLDKILRDIKPSGLIEVMGRLEQTQAELVKTGTSFEDAFGDPFKMPDWMEQGKSPWSANNNRDLAIFVGMTRDANGELTNLSKFGIGSQDLIKSFAGMRDSMISFSDESRATQEILAGQAAQMEKLGVSIGDYGKNANFLNKSLLMTGTEIANTTDKLNRMAVASGISFKKLSSDLLSVGPKLAAQGKQAVDVFMGLERQAKSLGMEVSSLLSIVGSSLDTFEGAAQAAGKFNAVMGGDYLNTMELISATEEQRVEIIKRSMDQTGKSFDQMSKYERIAVANALGISDINEAQMLLSGNTEDVIKKREKEAITQQKMIELQEKAVSVGDKLAAIFQNLNGIMLPFIKIITAISNGFHRFNELTKGGAGIVLVSILMGSMLSMLTMSLYRTTTALFTSGSAFRNHLTVLKAFVTGNRAASVSVDGVNTAVNKKMMAGSVFMLILTLLPLMIQLWMQFHDTTAKPHSPPVIDILGKILPAGVQALGQAIDRSIKPLLAFGAAMLMIGSGIWLAASGIANLVKSFSGLNPEQLSAANQAILVFGGIILGLAVTLGILAYSGLGEAAVAIMLGFGAAFLMIGGAVFLAATGMSLFVDSIGKLLKIDGIFGTMTALSAGILGVAASVAVLVGTLSSMAIMGVAAYIGAKLVQSSIEEISEAYKDFPSEKAINFKASTESLNETLKAVKGITSEEVKPTIEIMSAAKNYAEAVSNNKNGEDPSVKLLQKILELIKGELGVKNTDSKDKVSYKLILDDRQFGELIKKYESSANEKTSLALSK